MEAGLTDMGDAQGDRAANNTLAPLIDRCARRDETALRDIYDRYAGLMLGIATRITRRPDQARDLVQEAFIDLWRNADSFDPRLGNAEAWLISLVRYRALNQNRTNSRSLRLATAVEAEIAPETAETTMQRLGDDQMADAIALRDCLNRLPDDRRAMVVQSYLDGHTHDDLSRAFERPLGTVKTQIRAALRALQECLG